jgi:acyl-CoA reductase-like NAD-dependent aldehyde dehydrogenase
MPVQLKRYQMWINGQWVDAVSGGAFPTVSPFTGEPWAEIPDGQAEDVDRAVRAARMAFQNPGWRRMAPIERGKLLRRLGDLIAQHADELAVLETRDNGKLIREMSGQLHAIPNWYYYYAGLADKILGEVIPTEKPNFLNYSVREPIGVVGAIVPWNSPLLLATWKLAPALAAGNTIVIKPSEYTSASLLEVARLIEQAGFPPGVINVVTGLGETAGDALVRHPDVDKIAFTGGCETGKLVARNAAENLTRVTCELGGKSPNIVFDDADIEAALNGAIAGIFGASGQTCIAGSRLLLHESIHDLFVDRLVARAKTIKMGDPSLMETEMGPVATPEQLEKIQRYVDIGVKEGGVVVCGGSRPQAPAHLAGGWFFEPTIFVNVRNDMRIAQEEIFGPVLAVVRFREEEEAVQLANASRYGLAAGIWTLDVRRAHRMARDLEAGIIWINSYRAASFAAPWGGYKDSGYGRDNGMDAIKEYTQVKDIWVELTGATADPFKVR